MEVFLTPENKEVIIAKANALGGPQIKFVNPVVGYGLFAERNYNTKEFVAFYGGVVSETGEGDYVVGVTEDLAYDSEFEFNLADKGRWINENSQDMKIQNVRMRYDRGEIFDESAKPVWSKKRLYFVTTRFVREGEEFYWWYGMDYRRPWLMEGNISRTKAKEILRHGSVHGHKLTDRQRRYMYWMSGK